MKKNAVVSLLCLTAIALSLSACSSTKAQGQQNSVGNATSANNASSKNKIISQKITKLSNLRTPDTIFYYHDGDAEIYGNDDAKFKTILKLNAQRDQAKTEVKGSLGMLSNIKMLDFVHGKILEYNYGESGYDPIYFFLDKNSEGKYTVAQGNPSACAPDDYGWLASPDELIKYLNS